MYINLGTGIWNKACVFFLSYNPHLNEQLCTTNPPFLSLTVAWLFLVFIYPCLSLSLCLSSS